MECKVDWNLKNKEFELLVNSYNKKKYTYDCVIPIIGDGNDYHTVAKVLELGLSPLVVFINDYFKNDIGWHNLHQLISYFDVDSLFFNPNMHIYKDLVRTSLRKFDNVLLPFSQLYKFFPIHIAEQRKIPLIIWGAGANNDRAVVNEKSSNFIDVDIDEIIGSGAQVNPLHLNYYKENKSLNEKKTYGKQVYLSDYFIFDSIVKNKELISYGFYPENNTSSFDVCEHAGSSVYYGIHDLLKFKVLGYREIKKHVEREVGNKRITSEQGLNIINHYSKAPVEIKPFFDWLGVTKSGYEWFKLHRLKEQISLIRDESFFYNKVEIPDDLANLLPDSKNSTKCFITFGKGI